MQRAETKSDPFYSNTITHKTASYSNEEANNERYIIYPNDESSSFSNAMSINKDVNYDFFFNDHNDVDFFACALSAGDIISIDCAGYLDIDIFKYNGTDYLPYYLEPISNATKIVIEATTTYFFRVTGPYSTGMYSFKVNSYTTSNYCSINNYVRIHFSNERIVASQLVSFSGFSNLPSSGFKNGYRGAYGGNSFAIDYSGGQSLQNYASYNWNPDYIMNIGYNGIFNQNNVATGSPADDDRAVFSYTSYPASAIPYMVSTYLTNSPYENHATSFFVEEEYAFSAAHMVYDPATKHFADQITLTTSKQPGNTNYVFDIPCVELYLPYPFVYYASNTPSNPNVANYYDWCVMKLDVSIIPANYSHSFLGLSYPFDASLTYYNMGYPAYNYPVLTQTILLNDPNCLNQRILAGTSGGVYQQNSVLKTFMDLTHGHSGGPCLYKGASNIGIATGIVSGNTGDGTGNIFAPVNPYNFGILAAYLGGVI